jgi:hypothetical protein
MADFPILHAATETMAGSQLLTDLMAILFDL